MSATVTITIEKSQISSQSHFQPEQLAFPIVFEWVDNQEIGNLYKCGFKVEIKQNSIFLGKV